MKPAIQRSVCALVLCLAGCAPEFEPYNELSGLRVLAVRAEPPELSPGDTTTLDALVYNDTKQAVTQSWSLCPWPADPNDGYRCPVDQATFARAHGLAKLPGSVPALALATGDTATFAFPGDLAQARDLCEQLARLVGSSATAAPDCSARWDWTVRLVTEAEDARIDTIKAVPLLLTADQVPNQNPQLTHLSVVTGAKTVALDTKDAAALARDREHTLRVAIAASSIETFVPTPVPGQGAQPETQEALTFTWFVDAGSTDRVRSTYKRGVESLSDATENAWYAPKQSRGARLYVVARDHRGGIDWRAGRVQLVD